MKKFTKETLKKYMLENKIVILDQDSWCRFIVTQINEENFKDINPKLKEQLQAENKYNSWVSFVTSRFEKPYTIDILPIYGNSEKYITKYFSDNIEDAIDFCLNDSQIQVLKRANNFIKNKYNI